MPSRRALAGELQLGGDPPGQAVPPSWYLARIAARSCLGRVFDRRSRRLRDQRASETTSGWRVDRKPNFGRGQRQFIVISDEVGQLGNEGISSSQMNSIK